MLTDIIDFM